MTNDGLGNQEAAENFDRDRIPWVAAVAGVVGADVDGSVLVEIERRLVFELSGGSSWADLDVDRDDGWG